MKPLLRFLRRKMWNNRPLTISSFIGLLLAVSFTSSIPFYTDHALSRIISTTLNEEGPGAPPGSILTRYQPTRNESTDSEGLAALHDYMMNKLPEQIDYPQLQSIATYSIAQSQLRQDAADGKTDNRRRQMSLMSQSGLAEQIEIISGAMYGNSPNSDGIIEAMVWENARGRNYLEVGDVYQYTLPTAKGNKVVRIKIVGVFQPKDVNSAYWYQGLDVFSSVLMMNPDVFAQEIMSNLSASVNTVNWYGLYELQNLQSDDLSRLEKLLQRLEPEMFQMLRNSRVDLSFLDLIRTFKKESQQMQMTLFTLAAPMLALSFYFIYINARQSLERQRNDIAVLRSRGAEMRLIYAIFLLEGALLGTAAWLLGMLGAAGMARLMVTTDGFMQFALGKDSAIGWSNAAGLYGLAAVAIAILAGLLPLAGYGKQSIVGHKQELARADRKPLWQRWYIDVVLLLASGAGWYLFQSGQLNAGQQSQSGSLQIHPAFFFVPAVAVFSAGLVSLRLFPLLLKLLHRMLRRWLPITFHLALVQLSRSQKSYFPLMLLLVMTMGLGIYHASAARTIDRNEGERIMYSNGTDVVLQPVWEGKIQLYDEDGNYIPEDQPRDTIYTEPPLAPFQEMPGVKSHVRVLQTEGDIAVAGKSLGKGQLMGIDNVDFANSAWWRHDLYKSAHAFQLLRWLGDYEQGVIISQSFAERNSLKQGDLIQMTVQKVPIEFVVVGITEYWPSLSPQQPFVIANLDYVYDHIPLTPYALWLDMEDGAKVMPVVGHLRENGIETSSLRDARNERILQKLLPSREGTYGILTLGFIVSVAVSFIGYLLFWIYSLARRTVQMGILRATGLARDQLTFILLLEQLLTTGLAIGLGLGIGRLVSKLFLPLLQTSGGTQVPPFTIIFEVRDTVQLLVIVLAMLSIGACVLTVQIWRLRVHQAVKLGEER
ncbi:ABC transporter permease [Paenibacillus paeoniae]|uniref:ABC transporter permease n=1 Tax=Paenibacillus paeoniae TaxID=2292705 RepID=A0A371PNA2_9BACL|nr:ABC transporter permease [Paenibacillus paeoniae]REK77684.1 ABC transporter permease [Paenibacillus paeoniae]